jgi:hypothetical protein
MGDLSFAGQSTHGGEGLKFCSSRMHRQQPPSKWANSVLDRIRYRQSIVGYKVRGDNVASTQKTRKDIGRMYHLHYLEEEVHRIL